MVGNGSIQEALERVKDVEDDAAKERRYVREQFKLIRDELKHISELVAHSNTTADILLAMAKADEKRHEEENG